MLLNEYIPLDSWIYHFFPQIYFKFHKNSLASKNNLSKWKSILHCFWHVMTLNKRPKYLDDHLSTMALYLDWHVSRVSCLHNIKLHIKIKSKSLSETPLTVTPLLMFEKHYFMKIWCGRRYTSRRNLGLSIPRLQKPKL